MKRIELLSGVLLNCAVILFLCLAINPSLTSAALLDDWLTPVEESLANKVEGPVVTGNFYQPERPDAHGPIGTMGNHTHNEGEFMMSYRYMLMRMDGNRDGTNDLSEAEVLRQFAVTPTDMTTQMHMFSAMYGFNQTVTLTAMIPYIHKSMDHVRRMGPGFRTTSFGFGDLKIGTLWRLYAIEAPNIGAHRFQFNFGISLPTGDIKQTSSIPTPTGFRETRLPYPMQLGSGTVDLLPGLTYTGATRDVSWGFQTFGTIRIDRNDEDYRKGDGYTINGFGAYRWADWISTSLRFNWQSWGNYHGADQNILQRLPNGVPTVHTADPNRRGFDRLDILVGANILFPEIMEVENRLAVEVGVPIYQDLDGPQLETDYVLFAGWQFVK